MRLNLGNAVIEFLTAHAEQKVSALQLTEQIFVTYPEGCLAKKDSIRFSTLGLRATASTILDELNFSS